MHKKLFLNKISYLSKKKKILRVCKNDVIYPSLQLFAAVFLSTLSKMVTFLFVLFLPCPVGKLLVCNIKIMSPMKLRFRRRQFLSCCKV